jgi:hypothetical protein
MMNENAWEDVNVKYFNLLSIHNHMCLFDPQLAKFLQCENLQNRNILAFFGFTHNTYEQAKEPLNISQYFSSIILEIQRVIQNF